VFPEFILDDLAYSQNSWKPVMQTEVKRWDWAMGVSCNSQCACLSSAPGAAYFGVSDLSWRDGRLLFFLVEIKGKIL